MFLETGEYESYLWSNGETSKKIEIFDEGNYFVKVSDKDGNEYTSDTISIFASSPPEFDLLVKNITSSHSSSVEITNTDENRDYFVSIDNGEYKKNNFFINNLISGEHSITVRDSLGCESSQNFTILNLVKGSNNPEFNSSSIARKWIDVMLDAIRDDLARPPIHARNLFHLSSIMYDAFVIYEKVKNNNHLTPFLLNKTCLLYTSPSPRDKRQSRMPSSA